MHGGTGARERRGAEALHTALPTKACGARRTRARVWPITFCPRLSGAAFGARRRRRRPRICRLRGPWAAAAGAEVTPAMRAGPAGGPSRTSPAGRIAAAKAACWRPAPAARAGRACLAAPPGPASGPGDEQQGRESQAPRDPGPAPSLAPAVDVSVHLLPPPSSPLPSAVQVNASISLLPLPSVPDSQIYYYVTYR